MENIDCVQMAETICRNSLIEQAASLITKLTDEQICEIFRSINQ